MVFIGDINPIFSTGLLLGCTVLVATKNDIKSRRFRDIIFIVFSMILYLISFVVLHVYVFSYEDLDLKSLVIAILLFEFIHGCFVNHFVEFEDLIYSIAVM